MVEEKGAKYTSSNLNALTEKRNPRKPSSNKSSYDATLEVQKNHRQKKKGDEGEKQLSRASEIKKVENKFGKENRRKKNLQKESLEDTFGNHTGTSERMKYWFTKRRVRKGTGGAGNSGPKFLRNFGGGIITKKSGRAGDMRIHYRKESVTPGKKEGWNGVEGKEKTRCKRLMARLGIGRKRLRGPLATTAFTNWNFKERKP